VVRVIDGDTIEIEMDGQLYTVRYIGVDTPETKHPTKGVQPYGPEASERNRQLVEGRMVYLEKDVSETDRYGRLLRYVYVDDAMVNAVLVQEGYAQVATYPPDVRYVDDFLALQREAVDVGRGLWSLEGTSAVEFGQGGQDSGTSIIEIQAPGGCDPAYPTVCIPSPPPDLDCGEIQFRRFRVLRPDPHGFDRDKDGIGCESG
jgi:micrococcal nuclease